MSKASKLIEALITGGAITPNVNKSKAQDIIRRFCEEIHSEAVSATIIAENKRTFVNPKFLD